MAAAWKTNGFCTYNKIPHLFPVLKYPCPALLEDSHVVWLTTKATWSKIKKKKKKEVFVVSLLTLLHKVAYIRAFMTVGMLVAVCPALRIHYTKDQECFPVSRVGAELNTVGSHHLIPWMNCLPSCRGDWSLDCWGFISSRLPLA